MCHATTDSQHALLSIVASVIFILFKQISTMLAVELIDLSSEKTFSECSSWAGKLQTDTLKEETMHILQVFELCAYYKSFNDERHL